jgi:chromosome segregation ATPase
VEAQESALKAVAADLPIASRSTYSEILDLIKDLGGEDPAPRTGSSPKEKSFDDSDMQQVGQEIARLQQDLQEATASQKAADAEANSLREQLSETQNLIKAIEKENFRLTTRMEELTSNLNKTQHELTRTQEEHAESLETIAHLQEDALGQPPSPPPSPPRTRAEQAEAQDATNTAELEATHQAQIRSLQTAHSTAISTLRSSHAESMRKIRNLLTSAEQREAELRTELTTIRTSIATEELSLRKTFKSEIRRLEAVIAAKDETSAAVDERIALSVDKREREWERRVDLLLKERDRMAKALMMYWGEKEMGKGPGPLAEGKGNRRRERDDVDVKQGQAYKYKYAQKHRSRSGDKEV